MRTLIVRLGSVLIALALLAAPLAADAQPAKPARIGWLRIGPTPEQEGFREGLRDLGHVEGRTYVIEVRTATSPAEFPDLASDLARSRPDVIFAASGSAPAVKAAAPGVPVVFVSSDPIREGLVASFNRPGGNLTGIAVYFGDLAGKWVELLREVVPGVERLAILYIADNPITYQIDALGAAASAKKFQVLPLPIRGPSDLEPAFATAARQRAGAIAMTAHPLFDRERTHMVALAARHRLPAVYWSPAWAEAGGLMAYGFDLRFIFRQAAAYVDKILKGARPAELPVERPTKYELAVNLKTAKALGLTFPPSVLVRADKIIE